MEICAKGLFAKMNELQSFEELQSLINLEDLVDPRKSQWRWLGVVAVAKARKCPEEVQEKLRRQLQGLGLSGEGDPCRWKDIGCEECILTKIWRSDITGDLSSVKEMTDLQTLQLRGLVTGNVAELSKLKGLLELDLSQTQVMGDLAELSKLTNLTHLHLPHTQVSGNVAEVSRLKKLRRLELSQTEVMGDVSGLTNMTMLSGLSLAQSRVHGNFGVISSMPNLVKADLSGTAVSGNLEDLEGCCKKLRKLHLGVPASELQQCFSTCLWKSVAARFETCPFCL